MAAVVVTVLCGLMLVGHGPGAGEVVLRFDDEHGLNAGDLPVVGLWLLAMGFCGVLLRRAQ